MRSVDMLDNETFEDDDEFDDDEPDRDDELLFMLLLFVVGLYKRRVHAGDTFGLDGAFDTVSSCIECRLFGLPNGGLLFIVDVGAFMAVLVIKFVTSKLRDFMTGLYFSG